MLMCSHIPSDLFFPFKFLMSQSSSISQARLEIAEHETKGATTPIAEPASSPTCASLGLPPPDFPKRLACIELNSLSVDMGFDDKWVEGGIANNLMCSICQCLPRRAATFDPCGHIFCEHCIKQHLQIRSARQS